MPTWIGFAVKAGFVLAFIAVILWIFRWIFTRGVERQAYKETQARLKAEQEARDREKAIQEAARRVREAPGPIVPDLDELQRRARGETDPPRT